MPLISSKTRIEDVMTSVMHPQSTQTPDYANYSDISQTLDPPPPPPDRRIEAGSTDDQGFPEHASETLGYLSTTAENPSELFGHGTHLPGSVIPGNGFDVDFELDLASDAFKGDQAVTPAAFGGELRFPELPADLLDSAPEYEYSHHTRTNVFDATHDYAGDAEANRVFGLDHAYDPSGPLPNDEELFGLTNELGADLEANFNTSLNAPPPQPIPQAEPLFHDLQEATSSNQSIPTMVDQWGPSPASSFSVLTPAQFAAASSSRNQTPVNGGHDGRYFDDADPRQPEAKRRRETHDYAHPSPPPPAPSMHEGPSPPSPNDNGYGRASISSGHSTPLGTLYAASSPYGQPLENSTATWSSSNLSSVRGRVGPNWDESQHRAYYPSSADWQRASGMAGGSGGMYVSSSSTYGPTRPGGMIGGQRNSYVQYPMGAPPTNSNYGMGRSYIPESNHFMPASSSSQSHHQHQVNSRHSQSSEQNHNLNAPVGPSPIAALMPATFVGPGGIPVPTPGQSQIEMIDEIGEAVEGSVKSDGIAQCPYPNCTKTFAKNRTYNLKAHLRAHSQLKPFACTECPRAFSRRHDLERHARVHTGDKPYVCEVCQKGFPRSDALRRHWRVEKECGERAQEMERIKEEEKEASLRTDNSSNNNQAYSNPYHQNHQNYQNESPWNNQPPPVQESPQQAPVSHGRSTRNSSSGKRKR